MRTLAIANHKGGVGKTATAHALGVALAREHGRRVLLVDMDPQAALTAAAGITDAAGRSVAEVIDGATPGALAMADVIQDLGDGLAIAPADIALTLCELGLVARRGRENVLRRALEPVGTRYDVAIIDTPPSLGLLTVNALVAADGALVPAVPEVQGLRALRMFLDTFRDIQSELRPELELVGVLVTLADGRLAHHRAAMEAMAAGGLPLLTTRIGRSIRVAEASGAGESVLTFAPDNPRAREYSQLATEVLPWLNGQRP